MTVDDVQRLVAPGGEFGFRPGVALLVRTGVPVPLRDACCHRHYSPELAAQPAWFIGGLAALDHGLKYVNVWPLEDPPGHCVVEVLGYTTEPFPSDRVAAFADWIEGHGGTAALVEPDDQGT